MWNVISFLAAIPDLIKIYGAVKERIEISQRENHVKDDLKKIQEAFNEKDASKLDHIFNT